MLPDDLPDNVVPLRPRSPSGSRMAQQQGSANQAARILPGPAPVAPASPPVIGQVVDLSAVQASAIRQTIASQLAHAAPRPPVTSGDDSPRATSSRAPMATMPGNKHGDG